VPQELHHPLALDPKLVFCAKATGRSYADEAHVNVPELPPWARTTTAVVALRNLFADAALDRSHFGSPEWNPLGAIVHEGATVVIKPNWVHHENASGEGMNCLVTHPSVIEAILHYVAKAHPERIVLGDAPLQGCDFDALMQTCRVPEMIEAFRAHGVNVAVKDFRRTIHQNGKLGGQSIERGAPVDEFVLCDCGADSVLEAVTSANTEFRVTMYNPDLLRRAHTRGTHQYLIARDVSDADVVINVPKLKTHKKACITGALKNLVGINGDKGYLPHHRKGAVKSGGDCYSDRSFVKGVVEGLLDGTNRAHAPFTRALLAQAARLGIGIGSAVGADNNYEGSWYGNDTVWRMSLDLHQVLYYGRADGRLADRPQRTVITITDAIVAGEGDGPLAPTPVPLGMLTLAANAAAAEWVHALLIGLDPRRIPLTREAFRPYPRPLVPCAPEEVMVRVDGRPVAAAELFAKHGRAFRVPNGWRGHCERDDFACAQQGSSLPEAPPAAGEPSRPC
jgi:uncharacterized protein (DUF362 family)